GRMGPLGYQLARECKEQTMHTEHIQRLVFAFAAMLLLAFPLEASSAIMLVDVIPSALSSETTANSEPSIAVNPRTPSQMVITSFGAGIDPTNGFLHPYFYSRDGGRAWPAVQTNLNWGDITIAW